MRYYYITDMRHGSYIIHKETTIQSILSDLATALVLVVAIGLNILFSLLVAHSFIIDVITLVVIITYFYGASKGKK